MPGKKWITILGLIFLLIFSANVLPTEVKAATRGKIQAETVKYFKGEGYYLCQGKPKVEYKDYVITADEVQYFEKDDKAIFHGNVIVLQGKNKMVGYEMTANLKTDEFVMDGDVFIHYIRKSKDNKKADTEEDVIELRAQHVVYKSGDNDHLIATGKVIMEVSEDTIKADYLEYKGGEEIVIAKNNVEVLGKDEEKLNCNEFTYRIEGEAEGFDAFGGVQLEFTIEDDEEENSANTDKAKDSSKKTENQPTTPGAEKSAPNNGS